MSSRDRLSHWLVGGTIVAGAAGAVLVFAGIDTAVRMPLVLLFVLGTPALAVASLLGGLDLLAKIVVAGAAAIAIDVMIAEVMVVSHAWSLRTGAGAIALLSAVIVAARPLMTRFSRPRGGRSPSVAIQRPDQN